jgi:anionic cell wall polymer biosynthesis LytR-Cps2A-Psr (LCP) family protein
MQDLLQRLGQAFRRPNGAAFLSFLFPGLGQAALGQRARAAIIAVPALAVLAVFLLIGLMERKSLFGAALNSQWLFSLLVVDVVALIYHLWAVVDAYRLASQPVSMPGRKRAQVPRQAPVSFGIAMLVIVTLGTHAAVASVTMDAAQGLNCLTDPTGACMFVNQPTLAPGQTLAEATDEPQIVATDSGTPDSTDSSSPDATATFSADPNETFDPASLPSFDVPPNAANWAADGQLNVLLAGVDSGGSGAGRSSGLRPDTMIVLHVDLKSGRAAMIGIPRNTQCVPLPRQIATHYSKPSNGCPAYTYPYMLNWLANDAGWNHPSWFPFYQGKGFEYTRAMTATQEAIETLTGLTIDGFAVINLEGLVKIIDDVGGITITVPKSLTAYDGPCGPKGTWAAKYRVCNINPPHGGYALSGSGTAQHMKAVAAQSNGLQKITWISSNSYDIGFVISAGTQHMDGNWALAYARTRIYSTDYVRMMRQQLVLKAMRKSLNPCALLPRIPTLLNDVGSAFWTNLPITDAPKWAGLAQGILGDNVKSITLDPTTLGRNTTYLSTTTWAKAKYIVAHSLDTVPSAAPSAGSGGGGGGGGFSC